MAFNYIDLIITIPILFSLYQGFTKGLILSAATLVGLLLGIWGGFNLSHITANYLYEQFQIDIPLVAFGVTFLVILLAVYLLGKLLERFVSALSLGFLNNLGGAIFGALKMALILMVLVSFFEQVNETVLVVKAEQLQSSITYQYLKAFSQAIFPFFEELKSVVPTTQPTA